MPIVFPFTLRAKFLVAMAFISTLLTTTTLLVVRARVQTRVREQLAQDLDGSLNTFRALQQQREQTLERSAALLASLPPLMAMMTSQDIATIQDASATYWQMSGSQLFGLADVSGHWLALHAQAGRTSREDLQSALARSLAERRTRDWWFSGGRLFQVFLQPVYFGSRPENPQLGVLVLGFEVDQSVADNVAQVASSQVLFRYEDQVPAATLTTAQIASWNGKEGTSGEVIIEGESFLAKSVDLGAGQARATLTVLKSFDQATQFLSDINRWVLGVGIASVVVGGLLVFLVSTTFTRPLATLVSGVQALEAGDFAYPLQVRGRDEVSKLTAAFDRMRSRLLASQQELLVSERLATIGRVATSISHDLRHPLTAVQAYAEFLTEPTLTDAQRHDYFQEIRIAVNRMTEELNSLLGFSKQASQIRPLDARLDEVIERAMQSVRVLPEFERIQITFTQTGDGRGTFDANKIERVFLNLIINACEAVHPETGIVEIRSTCRNAVFEVSVKDNGPGIPAEVMANLFQPFVSQGKEKGIGLGLTVVHKVIEDHSGTVTVDSTGSAGTVFMLRWPQHIGDSEPSPRPQK